MHDLVKSTRMEDVDSIIAFLRDRNPLRRGAAAAGDGREKVTAGLPGLAPSDRSAVNKFFEHREHTDAAVLDKQQRDAELVQDGEWDSTSLAQQIGRPLSCDQICARLRALNGNLMFERSLTFPDIMGIYLPDSEAPAREGRRLRHIMGFEFGFSPEFTVYHPHAQGPKKITRGWRAVILQLAGKRLISFTAACKAFEVERGRGSLRWKREQGMLGRIE